MDLVAGVRKEGSRGGRAEFKWEDVKSDQHRENYLGHSLMAPVGRWQKNRDLSWYATSSTASANETAAQQRATEIRLIKEAERDALSAALGFAVTPRLPGTETSGAERKEVERVVRETADEELDGDGERGVGFGAYTGGSGPGRMLGEKGGGLEGRDVLGGSTAIVGGGYAGGLEGVVGGTETKAHAHGRRKRRSRSRDRTGEKHRAQHRQHQHHHRPSRRRSRSREHELERQHGPDRRSERETGRESRYRRYDDNKHYNGAREHGRRRSRSKDAGTRQRSRSRSPDRRRNTRRRSRSRSPGQHRSRHDERDQRR